MKADKKAAHEIKDAQLKAIRLRSQLSKKEENMRESKRKFKETKKKMMTAEAMANGMTLAEVQALDKLVNREDQDFMATGTGDLQGGLQGTEKASEMVGAEGVVNHMYVAKVRGGHTQKVQ